LATGRGREGREAAGRGEDCAAAPGRSGSERKKKGKEGGEADRRGPGVSVAGKKEKEEKKRWAGAGRLDGPLGRLGWKGSRRSSFFFFFFFKLHFQTIFHLKFKSNLFKLFLKNFINFLETTQATKNHASQLVMHKHLLSLSLLNYI
jgi:hypothetical protein